MNKQVSEEHLRRIVEGAAQYDKDHPYYDTVFNDTGSRLRKQGHATKEDIAILSFWKSINLSTPWARRFLDLDPQMVEDASKQAFRDEASDEDRLSALSVLPGFYYWRGPTGGAIPSTLLCCWDPENYAVTDIRVREALDSLGVTAKGLLEYLQTVRNIRDSIRSLGLDATARDVDKGLFILAGDRRRR